MELEKPVVSKVVPHWDLSLVLDCLKESPFEPMSSCSFKCLTQKTVFLIALASGRKHSEIHALSASSGSVNFSADKSSVKLHFFPGFLAKNQVPSVAGIPLEIPSLSRDKGHSGTLLWEVIFSGSHCGFTDCNFHFCLIHFPVIMRVKIFSPAFCDIIIMHMAD